MTFEEFKKWVEKEIKNYLPDELKDKEVVIHEISVLSGDYTGLTVRGDEQSVAPTANLERFYGEYCNGATKEELIKIIAEMVSYDSGASFDEEILRDYSLVKNSIFVRLCNARTHSGLLREVPHLLKCDMAVTCHVLVPVGGSAGSITVNDEMLKEYGVSKEQLFEEAIKNSAGLLPASIGSLSEMTGIGPENDEVFISILTNEKRCYGAAAVLYPGVLEELRLKVGDFYAIPSSVHEMIIIPKSYKDDVDMMRKTLAASNRSEVSKADYLSDNVFIYEEKDKELKIA
ncbi:MAG: hypothetical protein IJU01_04080 [Lachnospiraceae bacterium]|nr:hypothetical protein [Lachnospiraceae bacterium]